MTLDPRAWRAAPDPATTLSSLAHAGPVASAARLPWTSVLVGTAAIVLGSTAGGALAIRSAPVFATPAAMPAAPAAAAAAQPAASPHATRPGPDAVPAPAAPPAAELHAALVAQMKDALVRFVAWSHDHPGGPGRPCPDTATLGAAALDPWGSPLRIACADQPEDQIAGVLSLGPDGQPGTRDDVVSWRLGRDVTDLARGPRWATPRRAVAAHDGTRRTSDAAQHATRAPAASAARVPADARPADPAMPGALGRANDVSLPASSGAGSNDTDGDGIPDRR